MTEPYELKEETERLILVGVQEQAGDDTEDSVYELGELVQTAGAEVVGTMIQRREGSIRAHISERARSRRSG